MELLDVLALVWSTLGLRRPRDGALAYTTSTFYMMLFGCMHNQVIGSLPPDALGIIIMMKMIIIIMIIIVLSTDGGQAEGAPGRVRAGVVHARQRLGLR
jgi:hypothetical protein